MMEFMKMLRKTRSKQCQELGDTVIKMKLFIEIYSEYHQVTTQ